jgi:C4-dicarboxylate transporter DctM subunit
MNLFTPFAITIWIIVALSLIGLPIGLSMISASIVYLMLAKQDMGIAAEQILQGLFNSYTLLAIPLFIFAADLMNVGSLSDRLLRFCEALVGRFRGGLGHVNIVANIILSGMSGSAVADAAGLGRVIINMMTKDGKYTPSYAAAITAAAATIGPIIPPSIPLVLYALVSDASVGYLFLGGVVPGLVMGAVLMVMNGVLARVHNFPMGKAVPMRELPKITREAFPALMMPVVLLGGIYGGVMTPTEAAALAALYAYVISLVVYRSVSLRQTYECLVSSARSTAAVGMMIVGALIFNYVVAREDLPKALMIKVHAQRG